MYVILISEILNLGVFVKKKEKSFSSAESAHSVVSVKDSQGSSAFLSGGQ